jgi:hypothetical protein
MVGPTFACPSLLMPVEASITEWRAASSVRGRADDRASGYIF